MNRPADFDPLRRAMLLSATTVAWNMVVGSAAVITAVATGGLTLIGFGLNAVIDSTVSAVLVWRFHAESLGHSERAENAERLALRLAGVAFLAVALYLVVQATRSFLSDRHPTASLFGLVEAAASVAVLPLLARAKFRLARRLESRALRADSLLTWSGAALSAAALVALVLRLSFAWWWVDPAVAIAVAIVLLDQGRHAFDTEAAVLD